MPSFAIVDAHVHLWDPKRIEIPWIEGDPVLGRAHGLAEFDAARGAIEVARIVFVECNVAPGRGVAEAAWVAGLARGDRRITGIVAHAPCEIGAAVDDVLDRLVAHEPLRGVRRIVQHEADPAFCLRPDFVEGVRRVGRRGLSFDLCVFHHQLPAVIELVRKLPDQLFVLDHIAKPDIKSKRMDPWRAQLRDLAASDNVVCKISGMTTEADHAAWSEPDLFPYVAHVVDCFGVDRVLHGGDWPVMTKATTYPRWIAAMDRALAGASTDELSAYWRHNAERVYRLT